MAMSRNINLMRENSSIYREPGSRGYAYRWAIVVFRLDNNKSDIHSSPSSSQLHQFEYNHVEDLRREFEQRLKKTEIEGTIC